MILYVYVLVDSINKKLSATYDGKALNELVKIANPSAEKVAVIWFNISYDFEANVLVPLNQYSGSTLLALYIDQNIEQKMQEIEVRKMTSEAARGQDMAANVNLQKVIDEIFHSALWKLFGVFGHLKVGDYKFDEISQIVALFGGKVGELQRELEALAVGIHKPPLSHLVLIILYVVFTCYYSLS